MYAEAVELSPGDAYCTASPWYHLAGMGMALLALAAGAATVPCPGYTLAEWQRVRALRPTHVLLVPTVIDLLLAAGEMGDGPRVLHYGAAPIHPSTLREAIAALPSTRLVQIFGQTEVSPICSLSPEDHQRAARGADHLLGSVGRPQPQVELRVEAPGDDGVGELVVRAPHTFVVDADGWRRTGDLGEIDPEGYVHLRGRRDDMIVRGGENIYPLEVERVLGAHPGVAAVCVVGVPDRRWGEVVQAVVVPTAAGAVEPVELQGWARDRLAHFKVPAIVELVEELPTTPSGKVVRRALR
jgi:acyl-CoA synthetase (AMP-forming)/AMP-acid ligase II